VPAASSARPVSRAKVLAQDGADLNVTSKVNPIPRKTRNAFNDTENIEPPTMGGSTALHFAAREGHMDAIRALVEAGANVNQVSAADGVSTLTQAIINANFDAGKYLLDHGADPNLVSTRGLNALYATLDAQWACVTSYPPPSPAEQKTNYLELLKALLAKGANPNVKMGPMLWFRVFTARDWVDAGGATPFWRAAQADDVEAMRILVAAGADPNIPNKFGVSPLEVAAGFGYEHDASSIVPNGRFAAVKYLVDELHADVKWKDDKGFTPLHGAAVVGENDIIMYLVRKGADPKARANMLGVADGVRHDTEPGQGESVADMANGPFQRAIVYPDTIALLEKMGSANSQNCRAAACLNPNRPAKNAEKPKP